jgi:hypothetical protein
VRRPANEGLYGCGRLGKRESNVNFFVRCRKSKMSEKKIDEVSAWLIVSRG